MELSKNIKLIRTWLGESQDAFGERFGLTRSSVFKWEAGITEPSITVILKLEELTGIPARRLVLEPFDFGGTVKRESDVVSETVKKEGYENPRSDQEMLERLEAVLHELAELKKKQSLIERRLDLLDVEVLRQAGKKKG